MKMKRMLIYNIFILTFFLCIRSYASNEDAENVNESTYLTDESEGKGSTEEDISQTTEVTELDLGDYSSVMTVGEKQLLTVTVLPFNATDTNIIYESSEPSVAAINGLGRITAISVGAAIISVKCADKCASFELQVIEKEDTDIPVEELDLGDFSKEMIVESTQMLSVTVLPMDATDQNISYSSSDIRVATINGIGRITAVSTGSTVITVSCGGKNASFTLEVMDKMDNKIAVTDIEISNHEDELAVDETMTLSAKVLPADATESTVSFRSSDSSIATVNSSGEVKGISSGKVTIYVSAGNITKEVSLDVTIETVTINLNKNYLVLEPNDTYRLEAHVIPDKAEQNVAYHAADETIAIVSEDGVVTALKVGSTSIIVSNGDVSVAVSVIVNQISLNKDEAHETAAASAIDNKYLDNINAGEINIVNTDTLKKLYSSNQQLCVVGEGYKIKIDGEKIVNYENELLTDIELSKNEKCTYFVINQGEKLCGEITLCLDEPDGKYLYLYNETKQKYELLNCSDLKEITLTSSGKYIITQKRLNDNEVQIKYLIFGGVVLVLMGIGIYIGLKKKYWFW